MTSLEKQIIINHSLKDFVYFKNTYLKPEEVDEFIKRIQEGSEITFIRKKINEVHTLLDKGIGNLTHKEIRKVNLFVIPDRIIVNYGSSTVIYNVCLKCGERFKSFYEDEILCDICDKNKDMYLVPSKNVSNVYHENIIAWEVNIPNHYKRKTNNYDKCLIRDKFTCQYCGWTIFLGENKFITVDHLIPFSYNQNNKIENLRACCNECNSILTNKMFDTFIDKKIYLSERRIALGLKKNYYDEVNKLKNLFPYLFEDNNIEKIAKDSKSVLKPKPKNGANIDLKKILKDNEQPLKL